MSEFDRPMVNRDPNSKHGIPEAIDEVAAEANMICVSFHCDATEDSSEPEVASFMAMTPCLPRVGDLIQTQDGKVFEVNKPAIFRVVSAGEHFAMAPTVTCQFVRKGPKP